MIVERDRCHDARIARIGNIEDRGPEMILVRQMPHIGMTPAHRHLSGTGEIEMPEAAHIAGERRGASFKDVHSHSNGSRSPDERRAHRARHGEFFARRDIREYRPAYRSPARGAGSLMRATLTPASRPKP